MLRWVMLMIRDCCSMWYESTGPWLWSQPVVLIPERRGTAPARTKVGCQGRGGADRNEGWVSRMVVVEAGTYYSDGGKQVDDRRLLVVNGWGHPWSRMAECKKIFEFIKLRHNPGRFRIIMHRDGPTRIPLPLSPPMMKKSQQSPGPTGTTVSTSRALLRHPPGTLLQVTDTVPERPPCCDTCLFCYPLSAPRQPTPGHRTLREATPAVWRPTTDAKRDWRSRHTDPNGVESRDVTTQAPPSVKVFGSLLGCNMLNEGSRGRVQRLDVRGNKTPQTERDLRDKEELTFTATGKCKRNRDKDLLTELPKSTFNLGWKSGNNQ
ncbi:hypothetical protein GEV33_007505 [Tenebrio molitor]|uniref:Uncharacterized protein n=1 Tax=Tenebrio molitor TaxID=7067 RepID=A0A8J6LIS1_TENMO|nr:hypothetical protein GEV33_007505 [Tenebrio molitor]